MDNEKDIEKGLAFIRAQLMKRLNRPESDASTTELALATLALLAARDAATEERASILKFPTHLTTVKVPEPREESPVASPVVIRFEEATKETPTSRSFGASSCAYTEQCVPALRLYCED